MVTGEAHQSEASGRLVSEVLKAKDWSAVCVELCFSRLGYQGEDEPPSVETVQLNPGFAEAIEFCHENNTPLALVDVPESVTRQRIRQTAVTTSKLGDVLERANANVSPTESGDIKLDAVQECVDCTRGEIPEIHDVVHGKRDREIAKHVARVQEVYNEPVLVIVGAAHVIPLVEVFQDGLHDTETDFRVFVYYDDERSMISPGDGE